MAVYYNSTTENPFNIAYFRAQAVNSVTDVKGAIFTFSNEPVDPNYPGITPKTVFGDNGQFRLDLIIEAPTNQITVPVLLGVDRTPPPDYTYNPTSLGPVMGGINDYKSGVVVNTLFKVVGGTADVSIESLGGSNYKAVFSGTLDTDGVVRWFGEGIADTVFTDLGIPPWVEFSGELIYTRADDTTPGMDFYAGSIDFYALPEPASLGFLLLSGLPWLSRRTLGRLAEARR